MSYITICPECGKMYEEENEEQANNPFRECADCFTKGTVTTILPAMIKENSIVWVPSLPPSNINILPAEEFGKIRIAWQGTQMHFNAIQVMDELAKSFKEADKGDLLLCVGDPSIIALAAILLADQTDGHFSILKWDKQTKKYYAIPIII